MTLSDYRRAFDQGQSVAYFSQVASASEYYPFGMLLTDGNYSSGSYRFGFNGMEKDDEIYGTGNSMTAMFWQYDARLARRWNLDPKPNYSISQYSVFGGNPLYFTDVFGDTTYAFAEDGTFYGKIDDGKEEVIGQVIGFDKDNNLEVVKEFKFNDIDLDREKIMKEDFKLVWNDDEKSEELKSAVDEAVDSRYNDEEYKDRSSIYFALKEGDGFLDYKGYFDEEKLYVMGDRAYNQHDAGNYYTGYTSAKIKIPRLVILLGAQYNNIINANRDNRSNPEYEERKWYQLNKYLDPIPDQRAVWNGHKAAKSENQ